jgi:hypothetical protein
VEKTTELQTVYDSHQCGVKKGLLNMGKHYSQTGGIKSFREEIIRCQKHFHTKQLLLLDARKKEKLPKTIIAFSNGEAGVIFVFL